MLDTRVEGTDVLARGLAAAPELLRAETAQAMTRGLLLIEREARTLVKQDTRRLMGSITHSGPTLLGGELVGTVGPSARYGVFVEFGRRPGKMPPIAAIAPWARRHGMNPFLVARAIGRRGIKPAPFLTPAWRKHRPAIEALFAQVGVKLLARVAQGGR